MTGVDFEQLSEIEFTQLLTHHAEQLRALGPQPLAVACANNKFNDAWEDDFWCAVQVGRSYWEQSQFFHASSTERSVIAKGADTGEEGVGSSLYAVPALNQGRKVLADLEKKRWRQVGKEFVTRRPGIDSRPGDNIYALLVQHDQIWLWVGTPMDRGAIYACHPSGLIFVGLDDQRMDALIGRPDLILPEPFRQSTLPFLSPAAQAKLRPFIADRDASQNLADLAYEALGRVRQLTDEPVNFWLDPGGGLYRRDFNKERFSIGLDLYGTEHVRHLSGMAQSGKLRAEVVAFISARNHAPVEAVITNLDHRRLRTLFEQATGLDTHGQSTDERDEIIFVLADLSVTVIFGILVFSVNRSGGLRLEGYSRTRFHYSRIEEHHQLASAAPALFEPVAA